MAARNDHDTASTEAHAIHATPGACAICTAENILGDADRWTAIVPEPPGEIRALYDRTIVIDALATPNTFNVYYPPALPRFTVEQLANARRSGITAVNLTVHGKTVGEKMDRIREVKDDIAANPDQLILIETAGDLLRAKQQGRMGIILGFQGLEFMENELSAIDGFADEAVLIMQLTYNGVSTIGSGCLDLASDAGLKAGGRDAVARINRRNLIVDLAHSHPQTALKAAQASRTPIIVSHSACRAVYDHPRNQPDEVLRAVSGCGGVFGIYMMPYLGQDPLYASQVLFNRHLLHALKVCGEDHIGIGSDNSITPVAFDEGYRLALKGMVSGRDALGISAPLDGIGPFVVPGLNTPRRLEIAAWDLAKAGYSDRVIEKVLGQNFARVFAEVWAD